MALYTNTLTCTWAELQTALSGAGTLTANTSITISDPANVVLGNSGISGTLGYLIKNYTGSYLLDFTPSDFSTASYTTDSIKLFAYCTKLSGMCRLPSSITGAMYMFYYCTGLTSIDTSAFTNITSTYDMFWNCMGLTSIDTTAFKNVKDASNMFAVCAGLTSIDTSAFTNVTNADSMFIDCTGLTSIDTTAFTKVTIASWMFQNCTRLTSIDTSAFTNVTVATQMFYNCTGLTSIDTSGFTNVTNAGDMFKNCTRLTSIDTTAFTNVTVATQMFSGCTSLKSIYMYDCKFNLSSEPTATNKFMTSVPADCVFYVGPDSYDTWYSRLYTNYANWGLTAAKIPTLNKVYIYRRIA